MSAEGYTALIDPRDLRIYRVPSAKADVYRRAGWAEPDAAPEPDHKAIQQNISAWDEYGRPGLFAFARGVPLFTTALSKVVDKNTFENLAVKAKVFDENHPIISKALQVGGGVATAAAISTGVGALGGALGLGAEAAEAGVLGGEAAGLGAEAGAGAAEGAGVGAAGEAAGAAAEGAGVAEAGAGEATGAAQVGAGEGAAADVGAGEGAAASDLRIPTVEPPTGLMRTDQLTRFTRGLEGDITDAELVDGAETLPGATAGEAAAGETAAGAAEGVGAADTGLGADVGAGAAEAGEAATGEGEGGFDLADMLSRAGSNLGRRGLLRTAALGAAENVGFGTAYRVDNYALEHALSPEGAEKLTFGANDILLDAALGAGLPIGASVLGRGIGALGRRLTDQSITMFRRSVAKSHMIEAAIAQGEEGSLYRTIDPQMGNGMGRMVNNFTTAWKTANQTMEVIKARYTDVRLSTANREEILAAVERITGTDRDPVYQFIQRGLRRRNIDIQGLQMLTKRLDKSSHIVWDDTAFAQNPRNLITRDARNVLRDAQRNLIENGGPNGAEDAIQWARANQIASDNQRALSAISGKSGLEVDQALRNIGTSAATGAILGALGMGPGGALATGLRTGGWQAVHHLKIQHVAPFINRTGQFLRGVDRGIARAVASGLAGLPGQSHKLYNSLDYDETAAAVSQAGADPATTIANLQNNLNAQGIPQEFSVGIAQTQAAGLSHLKESIPKRNDAPDIATQDTGDPVQQHRWLDQVKTFQDPTYGLMNPTGDNLRVLKQFYPHTFFSSQQALLQQIANNPNLSAEAHTWASKLMERPMSNLDSPTFAQTLRQARQANQGQPIPGSSPVKKAGGGTGNGVESSLTRADQLQNR